LRVGLLTHAAGVNGHRVKTIDVLRRAPGVRLVKLFGPEHGIYGNASANVKVGDAIDRRTGLPVYSLYGETRRPKPKMLEGLDALLIDLQDVGARTYTYVSCMIYAMEACFEAGVKVIVLDRPNPLGGLKTDGPGLDKNWKSYVGALRVPYVHGLTIGELALMATRTTGWLTLSEEGRRKGRVEVVKMQGWRRSMRWRDTGLLWVATSPRIPHIDSVDFYPVTGLGCELEDDFTHGAQGVKASVWPFRFIRHAAKKPPEVERALRAKRIAGLGFNPMLMSDGTKGVFLTIRDWAALRPTELNFHMMQLSCLWAKGGKNPFAALSKGRRDTLIKHIGCEAFFNDLCKRGAAVNVKAWVARWERDGKVFQEWAKRFWLYPA
ncbi:MAG: DUF1343 domain-containing protein, partial [Puniceicoccales bacterium]|nr:DUF1343 domain-containing protein [Puniceicoccales bacterium]